MDNESNNEKLGRAIASMSGEYSLNLNPTPKPPRPPLQSTPEEVDRASTTLQASTEQISGGLLITISQLEKVAGLLEGTHKNLKRNTALTMALLLVYAINMICVIYMMVFMSRVAADSRDTQIQLTELVYAFRGAKEDINEIKEDTKTQNQMGLVETPDGNVAIRVLVPVDDQSKKKKGK